MQGTVINFLKKAFADDDRKIDLNKKDSDIKTINDSYMKNGCFWCAVNEKKQVIGTIALRPIEDFFEIRRFFVCKKQTNRGIGQALVARCIEYAIDNNISNIKAATMEKGQAAQHIFTKFGFTYTKKYNNSTADIFLKLLLTQEYIYNFKLRKLEQDFRKSLILNPTENIPLYSTSSNADFFEGLYVSERFKDVNDKVIFAGRNDYIKFFEYVKNVWKKELNAVDVDLKTLSGLNAHLILFLCILQRGDSVMLLPEICGGHFATTKILENLGATVIHMLPDIKNMCVDVVNTEKLIENLKPKYIFVDRSEGLIYEDFSWLKKYKFSYKIYDASQYFSQIINGTYLNPFNMGFDMIISTLHKNYPGPQKGIIAVKQMDVVWSRYLNNAKTYISNTHPMAIAKSLMPIIQMDKFNEYSNLNFECNSLLESYLAQMGVPVVKRRSDATPTLHIWILGENKNESYKYYLKLEQLFLLTNYRLLPYNLGFGLRIGTGAAVRSGLRPIHIKNLANIMAEAYFQEVTPKLEWRCQKLISSIITAK